MSVKESKMVLLAGKARVELVLTDVDQFPKFGKTLILIKKARQMPEDFQKALVQCYPFISRDNSSSHLQGIYLQNNYISGTDGKRIAIYTGKEAFTGAEGYLIPPEMARILSQIGKTDKLYIGDKIVASCGSTIVFSSGVHGTFPDVHKFIPKVKKLYDFPKEALVEGLNRISDFTDESKELSICKIEFGTSLKITYEGRISEIKEVFNFGKTLFAEPFFVQPYLFLSLLKYCDKFSFEEVDSRGLLYGQSADGVFKAIVAIRTKG